VVRRYEKALDREEHDFGNNPALSLAQQAHELRVANHRNELAFWGIRARTAQQRVQKAGSLVNRAVEYIPQATEGVR